MIVIITRIIVVAFLVMMMKPLQHYSCRSYMARVPSCVLPEGPWPPLRPPGEGSAGRWRRRAAEPWGGWGGQPAKARGYLRRWWQWHPPPVGAWYWKADESSELHARGTSPRKVSPQCHAPEKGHRRRPRQLTAIALASARDGTRFRNLREVRLPHCSHLLFLSALFPSLSFSTKLPHGFLYWMPWSSHFPLFVRRKSRSNLQTLIIHYLGFLLFVFTLIFFSPLSPYPISGCVSIGLYVYRHTHT